MIFPDFDATRQISFHPLKRPSCLQSTSESICTQGSANWIVDGLSDAGYDVHLAHPLGRYRIPGAQVQSDWREGCQLAGYSFGRIIIQEILVYSLCCSVA